MLIVSVAMHKEVKRDFSGASHSTFLLGGLSRPSLSASQNPSESQKNDPRSSSPVLSECPRETLKRTLSIRSVVSTSLSFAELMNRARARTADKRTEYPIIGVGSRRIVFEIPGTELAVKKGKDTEAMWNYFLLTNRVHNCYCRYSRVTSGCISE